MLSTCSSYEKSNRLLSDSRYTIGDNIQKLERKLGRNTGKDTPFTLQQNSKCQNKLTYVPNPKKNKHYIG